MQAGGIGHTPFLVPPVLQRVPPNIPDRGGETLDSPLPGGGYPKLGGRGPSTHWVVGLLL